MNQELTPSQIDFLKKEFGIEASELPSMSLNQINDLYEKLCNAEVEEALDHGDDPQFPRLDMASDMVDYIYNTYIA